MKLLFTAFFTISLLSCSSLSHFALDSDKISQSAGFVSSASSASSSLPDPLPVTNTPVALYTLNDNYDTSGNGYDLINMGAVITSNRSGVSNSAFAFHTAGFRASQNTTMNFTDELTISVWVNTSNIFSDQKIVDKVNASGNSGYSLAIISNRVFATVRDSAMGVYSFRNGTSVLPVNAWFHIALTWKTGGSLTTYVNGALDRQIAAGTNFIGQVTDTGFTIGYKYNDTFRLQGMIDDVRIYTNELSQGQIVTLAQLAAD